MSPEINKNCENLRYVVDIIILIMDLGVSANKEWNQYIVCVALEYPFNWRVTDNCILSEFFSLQTKENTLTKRSCVIIPLLGQCI